VAYFLDHPVEDKPSGKTLKNETEMFHIIRLEY